MSKSSVPTASDQLGFSQLVLSDYARYRPGGKAGWLHVLLRLPSTPGLLASIILRAQQCLFRSGRVNLAHALRTPANVLVGCDFGAGMQVGRGFMMVHPVGTTIGFGLVIGDDVTFAGGVTCAARHYDPKPGQEQEFPTICDGAVIGAGAVLVGGVRIGTNAMVGANAVVLSDVPDDAVVMGSPARRVGTREAAS
ncbi:bacterial transferase hexapeptide repeat protein [Aeromicrobium marinum DSM 15272]|uniref:Bacterial transferase hexapeptide repeat protein n=1 Tax=Aeromicrobium marinum DSM 15272 TaxID=585531 RepID=E2SFG0_9ACTN|nr:serine O-acetyltransferase [Aeromicrobium marinum]EFQ82061.1 bacterial transferase hexapeptide repeat protein [Aeromicrobium marinum DSM 15272]